MDEKPNRKVAKKDEPDSFTYSQARHSRIQSNRVGNTTDPGIAPPKPPRRDRYQQNDEDEEMASQLTWMGWNEQRAERMRREKEKQKMQPPNNTTRRSSEYLNEQTSSRRSTANSGEKRTVTRTVTRTANPGEKRTVTRTITRTVNKESGDGSNPPSVRVISDRGMEHKQPELQKSTILPAQEKVEEDTDKAKSPLPTKGPKMSGFVPGAVSVEPSPPGRETYSLYEEQTAFGSTESDVNVHQRGYEHDPPHEPIAAEVHDDDIEGRVRKQVQQEMNTMIAQNTVSAKVVSVDYDEENPQNNRFENGSAAPKKKKGRRGTIIIAIVILLVVAIGVGVAVPLALSAGGSNSDSSSTGATPPPPSPTTPSPSPPPPPNDADGCNVNLDGSLSCVVDNIPDLGFITIFNDCEVDEDDTVNPFGCQSCEIVLEMDVSNIDTQDTRCLSCTTCGNSIAYDCSNIGDDPCLVRDCDGECIGSPVSNPDVTPGPAPVIGGDICGEVDGSLVCGIDNIPEFGKITVFAECEADEEGFVNVFECGVCAVALEHDINDIDEDSPGCLSCETCGNSIAYDCSNLEPDDPCAVRNCEGECIGGEPSGPAPVTPAPTTRPPTTPSPSNTPAPAPTPRPTSALSPVTPAPNSASPTPGAAPSPSLAALYFVQWVGVTDFDEFCNDPQPGLNATCGTGGVLQQLNSSTNALCTPDGGGSLSCQASFDAVDFSAWIVYECIGSSEEAWVTNVTAVPDASVQCSNGGLAGTSVFISQRCPVGFSFEDDFNKIQCDPADAKDTNDLGNDHCFTADICTSATCSLSTPQVAASIGQNAVSSSCTWSPSTLSSTEIFSSEVAGGFH